MPESRDWPHMVIMTLLNDVECYKLPGLPEGLLLSVHTRTHIYIVYTCRCISILCVCIVYINILVVFEVVQWRTHIMFSYCKVNNPKSQSPNRKQSVHRLRSRYDPIILAVICGKQHRQ